MSRREMKAAGVQITEWGGLRIEVDGIVSEAHIADWNVAPMIALYDDDEGLHLGWRQMWNRPPTEAELDAWVRDDREEGLLPVGAPTP